MSFAVVAIPTKDSYVWKISTEKIPHLTILYLGNTLENVSRVTDYVRHTVDTSLTKFALDVDRRGVLGDLSADVLYFGDRGLGMLKDFQSYLLSNPDISNAYNTTDQHPEWIPHLTLGYPDRPAKGDPSTITSVIFDRIALWTGDFEGVEFPLKTNPNDLYMTGIVGENFLRQFGVKGMHWGVRKDRTNSSPTDVAVSARPGKAVKVSGGQHHSAHADAVQAAIARQKARKSSLDALSNQELQNLVNRMNLEQQYSRLITNDPRGKSDVTKFLKKAQVVGKTVNDVHNFLNSPAGKLAKAALKAKLKG